MPCGLLDLASDVELQPMSEVSASKRLPWLASPLTAAHRGLAVAGLSLYALSWITPSIDGRRLGAGAFVDAAVIGARLTFHSVSVAAVIAGISLLCGWLANFSIVLRLSARARLLWITAPWVPFAVLLLSHGPAPSPLPMLYFYPWAIGIGLIHLAHLGTCRTDESPAVADPPDGAHQPDRIPGERDPIKNPR